jgi:lipopolysaccharide transport system ATP-binding protein
MPAVTRLCGRAVWLGEGKVVHDGPVHQVTSLYMRSGSGTTAVREWPDLATAPGDENVRLCAVRIRNKNDKISETHDIRDPVRVEIEYHNFRNDLYAYANVMVYDEVGNYLFCSGDFVNRAWRHAPRRFTGRLKSTCTIPGNLLAEGQITVSVALTTHNPSRIFALERDAVAFLVVDGSLGDGARGEYAGAFPGIMRPLLDWQIEQGAPAAS